MHGCDPGRVSDGSRLALYQTLSIECPSSIFFLAGVFCLKKNLNAPRPSEHPPVRGKKCQNVIIAPFFLSFLFRFVVFFFALVGASQMFL